MIDINVPAAILDWASVTGTGAACDEACNTSTSPFTGEELTVELYGAELRDLAATGQIIDTTRALSVRGAVLLNLFGRLGVAIGYGRIIEPAGRVWAITADTDLSRWVTAYLPADLTVTLGAP